ncbi:MAG: hypothetical protein ACRDD7_01410 [Peptostreptococcaceae bacterium]
MTDKKYIYNHQQANFYMEKGVRCVGTGVNPTTNCVYWVFYTKDSQLAYEQWCAKGKQSIH